MKKVLFTLSGLLISLFSFSQVNSQQPTINGNFLRVKASYNLYIPHGNSGPKMMGGVDSTSLLWHNTVSGRVAVYQGKGMWNYFALLKDINWMQIMNKPSSFPVDWKDVQSKPVLFSGYYDSLLNKPIIIQPVNADWNATIGLAMILNKPALFDGDYQKLINKPVLFSGRYGDLLDKPVLFSGKYGDLTGLPVLFDGNYLNLTNRPVIPAKVSQLTNDANYISSEALFVASPAYGITSINISNWNTAYSWGNHVGLYRSITYVPTWSEILNKPTTISGYSITDAYTQSQVNTLLAAKQNTLTFDSTPTAGSTNPVTSNGIKASDDLKEALANKVTTYSSSNTSTTQYPSMAVLQAALNAVVLKGGTTVLPATLLAGANTNVAVTFSTAFADANYQAICMINTSNVSLLGAITATIGTKTATGCTVIVKNTGLLTLSLTASYVDVIAIKTN